MVEGRSPNTPLTQDTNVFYRFDTFLSFFKLPWRNSGHPLRFGSQTSHRSIWQPVKLSRASTSTHTLETTGGFVQNSIYWLTQLKLHSCSGRLEMKGLLVQRASCVLLREVTLTTASESLLGNRPFMNPMEAKDPSLRKMHQNV